MKRLQFFALTISTVIALGTFAGCGKTVNNETPSGDIQTIVLDNSDNEKEPSNTSVEDTTLPEDKEPSVVISENDDADAKRQEYANTFLSNFAEQFMVSYDKDTATPEAQMDFVRSFLKINKNDAVVYEKKGDVTYETFKWEDAQRVVANYFGISLGNVYENFSAPSGSFGDQPAGPYYENGKIWYEAADGGLHNVFAVADSIKNNTDGTVTIEFTVYEVDPDKYSELDDAAIKAYYKMTPDEAKAAKNLSVLTTGSAVVSIGQSGDYYLYTYHTN